MPMNLWTEFLEEGQHVLDNFWIKSALSALSGLAIWLMRLKHVQILGVFIFLVILDLVAKWAAIAYQMLLNSGRVPTEVSTTDKYWAIPVAFERGLISSEYMRKGFVSKVLTYVAATIAAVLFDNMAGGIGGKSNFAVNLVWLYLGSSEFLSILENLRDGGNKTIGRFLELAKTKIEAKVKL
nr:MAG TPA: holin [Caudoviricetes sp.]